MDPRGNPLPSSWAEDSAVEVSTLGMPPVASSAASAASLHTASETSSRARVEEMVFDDPRDGGRWNRSLVRGYFSEAPLMHAIPTMYVIGASTFAVSLLTYFLQTTVVNATGHVSVFFFGAFTCFSSYYMAAHFLGEHARSFQRITPDKKMYTVSNLIKAGVLAALTPLSIKALSDGMLYDDWNTNTIRNLGCIYAIPDFVSLIVVRRMSTSTVIHHIVVLIFCVFSLWNDFSQHNVFRGIAVYAVFSTFGYVVYMLLATRFLGVSQRVARAISSIALFVYLGSCGINWAWQVTYLRILYEEYHHWSIYPYLGMLTLVVYDDMNLCRWLLHNTKSHRAARSSTAATRPLQQTQPALPIHTASMSAGHTASPASRLGGSSSAALAPTS